MKQVTIVETPNYVLVSYGNGFAYSLVRKGANADVFVQGDDATEFRNQFDAMEAADPERLTDRDWRTNHV